MIPLIIAFINTIMNKLFDYPNAYYSFNNKIYSRNKSNKWYKLLTIVSSLMSLFPYRIFGEHSLKMDIIPKLYKEKMHETLTLKV